MGRFASIAGSFVYGLSVYVTGSIKSGIFSLIIFFFIGIGILFFVDEEKGILESKQKITDDN